MYKFIFPVKLIESDIHEIDTAKLTEADDVASEEKVREIEASVEELYRDIMMQYEDLEI